MQRKQYHLFLLSLFSLLLFLFPFRITTASADMGPKPSLNIEFEGLPKDEPCYTTILSSTPSTGPFSVHRGDYEPRETGEIAQLFREYKDKDGYYYLQQHWDISQTDNIRWGYYPPQKFKVLLYFPQRNVFISSGIYERYAFDSYYQMDITNISLDLSQENKDVPVLLTATPQVEKSYNYAEEILSMCIRICLTVLVELGIACAFLIRDKKQWRLLIGVNIFTQIVLNVILNFTNYHYGQYLYVAIYIIAEFIVFAVESLIYLLFMNRITDKKKRQGVYVGYAAAANALSFAFGLFLSIIIPGIF